jgi:transcriptional regulator with XRE-family HTH domain
LPALRFRKTLKGNRLMPRKSNEFDLHIAKRLRAARKQAGLSQTSAGKVLGVTFQQVQKQEQGTNRIGAGNLFKIALAYNVPITWFFEGLAETKTVFNDLSAKFIGSSHGVELARDYLAIKSPDGRRAVADVAAAFAKVG